MPVTEFVEEDYGTERDRIKRLLAQAAALRQRGEEAPPQGRMLPGAAPGQPSLYVKPHASQYAAPIVAQIMGLRREKQAENMNTALSQRQMSNYDQWMASRPQATTTQTSEEIPGTEAPGPMPEGQTGPLQKVRAVIEKTEPTREQQIDWAGRGMKNPLSKGIAAAYMEDALVKQPEREAAREFKAEEAERARQGKTENIILQGKNKLAELEILSADKTKTRDQQLVIERMKDSTRRSIASAEAQARVDAASIKAKAAGAKVTPVPNNVVTKMSEAEQNADGITSAYTTFKPEYGGWGGAVQGFIGRNSPLTTDEQDKAAAWWNNYESQAALVKRHSLFGSAFTPGEQEAWDKATIRPRDNPQLIATNLKVRAELANKFYNKLRNQYVTVGHAAVGEAFPERPDAFQLDTGATAAPTTNLPPVMAPVQQPQPRQRRKTDLPPGVTIGDPLPGT